MVPRHRACPPVAVEYGLASPGQLEARGLQRDANEVSIGRCRRFLVSGRSVEVHPARDRDIIGRSARALRELPPFAFVAKRRRLLRNFLFQRSCWESDPGATCLHIGKHRLSLLSFAAGNGCQTLEFNKSMQRGYF
jgi:hypothetical protein